MKRYIPIIFFILLSVFVKSQSLSVESFKLLENDLTANTNGTIEYDQNGEKAALIKMITTETGFVFDPGIMGIVKQVQKVSEVWVYIPRGLQRLKIMHPQLGQVEYYFPIPIESARTYELKLISGTIRTIVEQTMTSQFVVFEVEPKEAVVFIDDDEPRSLDSDGMLSIRLGRGHHTYKVTAASFVPESGVIEVESDKIIKQVTLKSAKATLTVNTVDDAEIWINEIMKGVGSWSGDLEAGVYLVESRRPSHRSQKQEITLDQQERRTVIVAEPLPMYGSLEIEGKPIGSNVYLDGELIGQIPLIKNRVLVGKHLLTVEKQDYQTKEEEIIVEEGNSTNQVFALQQNVQQNTMSYPISPLSVESFKLLENDLTANTYGTMERDQNGDVTALIKFITSATGFNFDCGMMGIVKVIQKTGEIWVYVPRGVQRITISHPQLGVLRDYYFPVPIEKARTYEFRFTSSVASTTVAQDQTRKVENGHEYVDLGLSVKWATCNVGASKPEDYGDDYAWGETETKNKNNFDSYKYFDGSIGTLTKYNNDSSHGTVDNKTKLDESDDVAHVKWGGSWRMPTRDEFAELRDNCTWKWTTQNGVNGYLVTSKKSGYHDCSIFLPAAGYRLGADPDGVGSTGYYWSSSLFSNYPYKALALWFYSDGRSLENFDRYYGCFVRPVCP